MESTDGQAIKISEEMNFIGYTYESKKLAFTKNEILKILTFPDGNLISQWNMLDYHVDRGWWSPDGKYLALQGFSTKDTFEAIFIVMP